MAIEQEVPARVGEFLVLPVRLPSVTSFARPLRHYFYASAYDPKHPDQFTPLSLFLANLPIDATDALLKHMLSEQLGLPAGRIRVVQYLEPRGRGAFASEVQTKDPLMLRNSTHAESPSDKKRKRDNELQEQATASISIDLPMTWDRTVLVAGTNAVIGFVDRASRDAALKAIKNAARSDKSITWGDGLTKEVPPLGLRRYLNHYELTYPPQTNLLHSVNDYMTAYNEREAAQARLAARKRQEPDEDGFVTVTRGGRMGVARPEAAAQRLEKEKVRKKGYADFYRSQFRENRKRKAVELIQRFQEDRAKMQRMREQRKKFQPE